LAKHADIVPTHARFSAGVRAGGQPCHVATSCAAGHAALLPRFPLTKCSYRSGTAAASELTSIGGSAAGGVASYAQGFVDATVGYGDVISQNHPTAARQYRPAYAVFQRKRELAVSL